MHLQLQRNRRYDADWLRAEFMGRVKCSLGRLLEPMECVGQTVQQWWVRNVAHSFMVPLNTCKQSAAGNRLSISLDGFWGGPGAGTSAREVC